MMSADRGMLMLCWCMCPLLGGNGGHALCLQEDLQGGYSEPCDTFKSIPLCKGHFKIQALEVWGIQNSISFSHQWKLPFFTGLDFYVNFKLFCNMHIYVYCEATEWLFTWLFIDMSSIFVYLYITYIVLLDFTSPQKLWFPSQESSVKTQIKWILRILSQKGGWGVPATRASM